MDTAHAVVEISLEERLRRQSHVDNAVHSLALEGLTVTGEDIAFAAEYVDGTITIDEFVDRGRAVETRAVAIENEPEERLRRFSRK